MNSVPPAFIHMAWRRIFVSCLLDCVKIIDAPKKKSSMGLIIESLLILSISFLETSFTSSLIIYKYASSLFESNMLVPAMMPSKSDMLELKLNPTLNK